MGAITLSTILEQVWSESLSQRTLIGGNSKTGSDCDYHNHNLSVESVLLSDIEDMSLKVESGLSVLSRLCNRPSITHCFGPGLGQPCQQVTMVRCQGDKLRDSVDLLTGYVVDVICNLTLPRMSGDIMVGGCEAGVVLMDCDHHVKVKEVALALERRVAIVAEQHWKDMKERGLSREEREKKRINSTLQWDIVKASLARLLIMRIYTPDQLEISLISLQNILIENNSVSAVFINGINSFYFQVRGDTSIPHNAYVKKLLNLALEGCKDTSEELKIFYVEHNLFGEKNDVEKNENSSSDVVIEKLETNFSVTFLGHKSQFSLNSSGQIVWG